MNDELFTLLKNARERHPRRTIWILKSWMRVIQKFVKSVGFYETERL